MQRASFIKICSANGRPNNWCLNFSNVGSESCSISMPDGFVNCAMITIVLTLC